MGLSSDSRSPLDEAIAIYRLLSSRERVLFWAAVVSPARPRPPADAGPLPLVKLDPEPER